jgi:hypothetical protein
MVVLFLLAAQTARAQDTVGGGAPVILVSPFDVRLGTPIAPFRSHVSRPLESSLPLRPATTDAWHILGTPASAASRRSPVIAGTLGFLVPGGGHLYAGEPRRGLLVLGLTTVGAFFALTDGTPHTASTIGSVLFVGGWSFSVIDGVLAAGRHNGRP